MLVINGRSHIWYFYNCIVVIHVNDVFVIAVVSAIVVVGVIVGDHINVPDKRVKYMY